MKRIPWAWLLSACLFACWIFARHSPSKIDKYISIPSLHAEVLYLDASSIVQRGPSRVIAIRFVGDVDFVPYTIQREGIAAPMSAEQWSHYLSLPVVLNAGQFDPDLKHLGWLRSRGEWLQPNKSPTFMGLIASGSKNNSRSTLIDLEREPDVSDNYQHVIQSMMLLDETKKIRVRQSTMAACRTVIAKDVLGRWIIFMTEGAVTLYDFAQWLLNSSFHIQKAMNLDGGVESQLSVVTPEYTLHVYGQYGPASTVLEWGAGPVQVHGLPAVLAILPK